MEKETCIEFFMINSSGSQPFLIPGILSWLYVGQFGSTQSCNLQVNRYKVQKLTGPQIFFRSGHQVRTADVTEWYATFALLCRQPNAVCNLSTY